METQIIGIPEPTIRRLPLYYHYLKTLITRGREQVSCTHIGKDLDLDPTQIRKDLAFTGMRGQPKIGYNISELIKTIENFFGWNRIDEAFLVGAGNLGKALLGYEGFGNYGFKIIAAFDQNPDLTGSQFHGKEILPMAKLPGLAKRLQVKLGVITVPEAAAQEVADIIVKCGIIGIWNFAPISLKVPPGVFVENETIASGLAVLTKKLQIAMQSSS
ncbi:MAG: redox-sensing transcriptional repressor Rex [Candidatus Rifleibacteriota bacterium]